MVIMVLQMFNQGMSMSWGYAEIIAALAQEHFVQIYQTGSCTHWGLIPHGHFSLPAKANRQHHPHSVRSVTQNRLLLWMSNFIRYTHQNHFSFFFICQKWVIEAAHCARSPPTRACVQLLWRCWSNFVFFPVCCCHQLKIWHWTTCQNKSF